MAEQNKDDLADALAALAAGHHQEPDPHDSQAGEPHDEHAHPQPPSAPPPPPPAPPKPVRPGPPKPTVASRPAPPKPEGAPVPRLSAQAARADEEAVSLMRPRPTTPAAPVARPSFSPAAPRPTMPAAQQGRAPIPAPPSSAAQRTGRADSPQSEAAAESTPPESTSFVESASEGGEWAEPPVDEDDMMLAPAPDASALGHFRSAPKPPDSLAAGLGFKQTLIPVLLTSGVLLIIFGSIKFFVSPDSPYRQIPPWIVATVFGMAAVLLGLAVVTMLQVKFQLEQRRRGPKR